MNYERLLRNDCFLVKFERTLDAANERIAQICLKRDCNSQGTT